VLPHEKVFLEYLPSADQYYKSFMHRDIVNFVVVTRSVFPPPQPPGETLTTRFRTDFIVTTSIDGHLKFWKKMESGIEFVKHYHAHLVPIVSVSASADGAMLASIAEDGTCKVFDVVNFGARRSFSAPTLTHAHIPDLINILDLGFIPGTCYWVHRRGQAQALLAVCVVVVLAAIETRT
jgi:peptidylprolyl isomerase domain and WD repeat-containing protein 1